MPARCALVVEPYSAADQIDRGEEGNPDAVAAANVHAALLANTKTAGTGRGSLTRLRYELNNTVYGMELAGNSKHF